MSYIQKYFHKKRKMILEALGNCCEKCGSTEHLEVHHRDNKWRGRGRGRQQRIKDYLDNLENGSLQLLCRTCHRQHHNELKTKKEVITKDGKNNR